MKRFLSLFLFLLSLAAGAQTVPAFLLDAPAGADTLALPPREIRAVWLTTLSGLDWPASALTDAVAAEREKQSLCRMLDQYAAAGFNVVLFQSRIRGTTAYRSAIEPWDAAIGGRYGREPLFDPLAFAVEEAHRRGLQLHAWVVAFPVCKPEAVKALGAASLPRRHPELCRKTNDGWMMDPGVPGTDDYLAALCAEIARNYDVDGIHLDYIRYPEASVGFSDAQTYRKYGRGQARKAWERENVSRCVRKISGQVKSLKPWLCVSCSPIGKYADLPLYSSFGWNARDAVSQDVRRWQQEGWMDWLFPMMYFDGRHFYPFAFDWAAASDGRPVAAGLATYQLDARQRDWPLAVVQRQMRFARQAGLQGQAQFRSRFLLADTKGIYTWLKQEFYASPALPPAIAAVGVPAPAVPKVSCSLEGGQLRFRIVAEAGAAESGGDTSSLRALLEGGAPAAERAAALPAPAVRYNVYRVGSDAPLRLVLQGVEGPEFTFRPALPRLLHTRYAVTAFDRFGRESAPVFVAPGDVCP